MGDVDRVVRIQRDVDVRQLVSSALDESGQALHVLVSAGDRQGGCELARGVERVCWLLGRLDVAKVVLRIDDEQVDFGGGLHGDGSWRVVMVSV